MAMSRPPCDLAWFEQQPENAQLEAARRDAVIAFVYAREAAGLSRRFAVASAAAEFRIPASTIKGWLRLLRGVSHPHDRLPALCPKRGLAGVPARPELRRKPRQTVASYVAEKNIRLAIDRVRRRHPGARADAR